MAQGVHQESKILTGAGFNRLEFPVCVSVEQKLALYELTDFSPLAVEKAKDAIFQQAKQKGRQYKGDLGTFHDDIVKRPYLVKTGNQLKLVSTEQVAKLYQSYQDSLGAIRYFHQAISETGNQELLKQVNPICDKLPRKLQYALQFIMDFGKRYGKAKAEENLAQQIVATHALGIACYYLAEYGETQKPFHYTKASAYFKQCIELSNDSQFNPHFTCCESHIKKVENNISAEEADKTCKVFQALHRLDEPK